MLIPVTLPPSISTKEACPISWMNSLAIFIMNPRKRNVKRNLAYSLRRSMNVCETGVPS